MFAIRKASFGFRASTPVRQTAGLPPMGLQGNVAVIDELAVGAKAIRVIMEHTSKQGEPHIVKACTYPLTAAGCVKRICTNLAGVDMTPRGLVVIEMTAGMTLEKLQALIGPRLQPAPDGQMLAPPGTPEARAA